MQTSSNTSSFRGVFTAIVTPFLDNGEIDWKNYEKLLDFQLTGGVHGIIPCGTTGESPTLSGDEKAKLVEIAVERCRGKARVIAGTGSNDTKATIDNSKRACAAGADALLVVTPYYNKPSQAGLEAHFRAVADASPAPVILYNVPGRTGVSLAAATVAKLAAHPKIVGIKEATGNLGLLSEMRTAVRAAVPAKSFVFLSGDDITFWPFMACGGDGVISVASNVLPRGMRRLFDASEARRLESGLALHEQLSAFFNGLFIEANPGPVKHVLSWTQEINDRPRLPLVPVQPDTSQKLKKIWSALPAEMRS